MAAFDLNVKVDVQKAMAKLSAAKQGVVAKAATAALNRTIKSVKTQASKDIRSRLNLKLAIVNPALRLTLANPLSLTARVSGSVEQIPLKQFKPYDGPDGVTVLVNRQKGSVHYPHAWISHKLGDHVFERVGTERLPIKKLFGPNIAEMLFVEAIRSAMRSKAGEAWRKNFLHELQFRLAKVGIHIRIT